MKKEFIIILTGLITMGCSQGDTNQVNNQQTINKYSFYWYRRMKLKKGCMEFEKN